MLGLIGKASLAELFSAVPESVRLDRPLRLPAAMSKIELTQAAEALSALNRAPDSLACFLGAGGYDYFVPTVVDSLASRGEFVTAYTPYRAEASQGSLQVFYEFQTLICQLTGMDVVNASMYEAGSAVAESVIMAQTATGRRGGLVAGTVHPQYLTTGLLQT